MNVEYSKDFEKSVKKLSGKMLATCYRYRHRHRSIHPFNPH